MIYWPFKSVLVTLHLFVSPCSLFYYQIIVLFSYDLLKWEQLFQILKIFKKLFLA